MRPLRAVPERLPNIRGARAGDRVSARADRADEGGPRRARWPNAQGCLPHGALPSMPGLRGGVPIRRPVRQPHGSDKGPDFIAAQGAASPCAWPSATCCRIPSDCIAWAPCCEHTSASPCAGPPVCCPAGCDVCRNSYRPCPTAFSDQTSRATVLKEPLLPGLGCYLAA